jgi:hypothetical protein
MTRYDVRRGLIGARDSILLKMYDMVDGRSRGSLGSFPIGWN